MSKIGAYYENALDQVLNPGRGADGSDGYYIPPADGSMDCATLKTNFDKIENQIAYWFGILQTGDNGSRERENLNKIINTLQTRKDYYSTLMLRNCTIVPETKDPGTTVPDYTDTGNGSTTDGSPSTSNTALAVVLVAGGLGGLYLLTRKKKKSQSKKTVKGIQSNDLLIAGSLLATGIAVRAITSKKAEPELQLQREEVDLTNQPGEFTEPSTMPVPFDQMPSLNDYTQPYSPQILYAQ